MPLVNDTPPGRSGLPQHRRERVPRVAAGPARRPSGRSSRSLGRYLAKNGFQGLTVDKLMQETQIGRSAFYVYFKDLYDLAGFFILELSGRVEEGLADWFDNSGPPLERIRAGLTNAIAFWEKNGRMIRALEAAAQQDERLRDLWRGEGAVRVNRLTQVILRDQAAGLIGPMDAYEVAVALNRFNVTYLNDSFGGRRSKDKQKALETMERVWIGTLYGRLPAARILSPGKRR